MTVRNLTSPTFIAAGYADTVDAPTIREVDRGDGTYAAGRELRRGDAYSAEVYTPQTDEDHRRGLGLVENPGGADLAQFRRLVMRDEDDPTGQSVDPGAQVRLHAVRLPGRSTARPTAGSIIAVEPDEARAALEQGPYRRTWELAQRLRARAETQEDLVQSVLTYLGEDFGYTEQPTQESSSLEGFLFDSKLGYCQHFSGAMALVLRMAGVPSRVVTGFTSGALDRETREYVVRDLDAHSWVEVWYPNVGWVIFDPTPTIALAARAARGETARATRARPPAHRRACPATSRPIPAAARWPRRRARPGAGSRPASPVGWRSPPRSCCCGAVAAGAPEPRRPPPRSPSSSARCAARVSNPVRARRCTRWSSGSPRAAPRPPATCGR